MQRYRASVTLQCQFRRFLAQSCYSKQKSAIILQRVWRGSRARNNILNILHGVVKFQAAWRGHSVREIVCCQHEACVCFQRIWRGFWAQLQYQMLLLDIITVQSVIRRRLVSLRLQKESQTATLLQCWIRKFLAVRERKRQQQLKIRIHHLHNKAATAFQVRTT